MGDAYGKTSWGAIICIFSSNFAAWILRQKYPSIFFPVNENHPDRWNLAPKLRMMILRGICNVYEKAASSKNFSKTHCEVLGLLGLVEVRLKVVMTRTSATM